MRRSQTKENHEKTGWAMAGHSVADKGALLHATAS